VQHRSWSRVWGSRMTTPRLTPKPRTPDRVWNFFNRKRDKPVSSKPSIWNCQTEPHGTVGVLTVPFSGRYVRGLESLKAMESHSVALRFPAISCYTFPEDPGTVRSIRLETSPEYLITLLYLGMVTSLALYSLPAPRTCQKKKTSIHRIPKKLFPDESSTWGTLGAWS
jgi:hypothetical protein